jgi:hypothetical protein
MTYLRSVVEVAGVVMCVPVARSPLLAAFLVPSASQFHHVRQQARLFKGIPSR